MARFATLKRGSAVGDETLGARLLRARLEYGSRLRPPRVVTQLDIGRELGVSGVAVGGWEADRNEPGLDKIRALARFYGVRVGWLIDGEMPMRDTNDPPAPTPPLEMFRELRTGDDLRDVLGEQKGKKKRSNDAG
jgi:transcriptional regulator with XRE-family HTH domain